METKMGLDERYLQKTVEPRVAQSFLRSQFALFNSRKKFGLLYALGTIAGMFCLPGVMTIMVSENDMLTPMRAIIPPLASLLVSLGLYVLNDLVDSNLDKVNSKNRPISSGLVSKRQAWSFIMITNGSGIILALITLNLASITIVASMLLIGVMYSAPKISLMNRFVIKNLAICGFYMLCVLLGMTSSHALAASNFIYAIYAMTLFGIMIFVGSIVNDLGDIKGDEAARRSTIPIVVGGTKTVRLLMILLASMSVISWSLYSITGSISLTTPIGTSILAFLALLRMVKISQVVDNADSIRMQHKKWFPLHVVLQTSFIIGSLALI